MATNKNNIFNRAANTARNNSIKTTLENVRKAGEELRKRKEEEEKAKKTVQPMRSLKDTFANIAHQVDNAYNSGDYLRERENRQQATPAANAPKKRTLQLATMAEEQRSVMQSWNDFLNRMNTPAAAAQNKPQSSMGIYSPKDPRNPNRVNKAIEQDFRAVHYQPVNKGAPKNQWVYEDFKKKGKGAGWLAGSEKLYESTRIDPMMSQIIETVNNLGKWDNEKDQPYYKYSARKNREIEFENQQRADAIASKMKEYENLDFLTNPENSRFYEEDVLNGAMENKAYDIVTFGLKYNDANGNPHTAGGKNGTWMSTEEYETNKEEYNQMMFREMWGDEALQTELAKNGGKLSPRYSQEMERMWDKLRLSYDDLDATKNYHLKIAEEAGKQAKAYEDYDQLMVDSGRKLSQIENASPDFIPGNERTGYGASKLDNIYSFITGNKAYADVIKNAESDERYETDTALANAYDGAIFMTPDEKELFIRYYNAGPEHREELEAFMEGLQPSLNMRKVQREEQLTKYMADVLPGSQAVASVAANKLAGGMELLAAGGRLLGVVDNDTDSDWERLSRYVKTVRTELSKNAYDHVLNKTKSEFLADLAEHGINTLFSIADFTTDIWLANGMTALTGATTAEEIAAAGKAFSLGLMSLESFGSAYYDAYQESDGDNTYATAKAGLSALLELSTETIISMDRIFSTDTEGAKRLINAILGEAFEETTGSVLEPGLQTARQMIYNYLTGKGLDGQTEWERNAQEIAEADPETYMYRDENGNLMIDKGKAMKAALNQWEEEILWSTLAGAASAAPGSIIAESRINGYSRKLGKTIRGAEA
ncbi:MAG: hypothetical protein J6Y48_19435, partial [Clostridia bacterium]|nr:hypothetical protein [Clostridia bacterium]